MVPNSRPNQLLNFLTLVTFLSTIRLLKLTLAEEQSIMDLAAPENNSKFDQYGYEISSVIDGNFRTYYEYTHGHDSLKIQFPHTLTVVSSLYLNDP